MGFMVLLVNLGVLIFFHESISAIFDLLTSFFIFIVFFWASIALAVNVLVFCFFRIFYPEYFYEFLCILILLAFVFRFTFNKKMEGFASRSGIVYV